MRSTIRNPPIFSKVNSKLSSQYYNLSGEISRQERELKEVKKQNAIILERFEELESQIIHNSAVIKKKKIARKHAQIGLFVTAIALLFMIGINVDKSNEKLSIKYDSNNLMNLIITFCGGGGAIYGLNHRNKEEDLQTESEAIFTNNINTDEITTIY